MRPNAKVVDASALGAVVFGEPRAREVVERLGEASLVAPTLLRYELSSVCLKKIGRYSQQRDALVDALSLLDRLDLAEVDVPAQEIVRLAEETGLTVYDAAYLWLAQNLRIRLVTLDEALSEVAERLLPQ